MVDRQQALGRRAVIGARDRVKERNLSTPLFAEILLT